MFSRRQGASILGVGYLLPFIYFIWSIKRGRARTEPMACDRSGVANIFAAAKAQFHKNADGDRTTLHVFSRKRCRS